MQHDAGAVGHALGMVACAGGNGNVGAIKEKGSSLDYMAKVMGSRSFEDIKAKQQKLQALHTAEEPLADREAEEIALNTRWKKG